jgi:hypothetical protein
MHACRVARVLKVPCMAGDGIVAIACLRPGAYSVANYRFAATAIQTCIILRNHACQVAVHRLPVVQLPSCFCETSGVAVAKVFRERARMPTGWARSSWNREGGSYYTPLSGPRRRYVGFVFLHFDVDAAQDFPSKL